MDTLALLCNLHAAGPATVRRLHRAGCHDVADLERLSPAAIAAALGSTPGFARRFAVEARHLARRVRAELPDDEAPETADLETELLASAPPAPVSEASAPSTPAGRAPRPQPSEAPAPRSWSTWAAAAGDPVRPAAPEPWPAAASPTSAATPYPTPYPAPYPAHDPTPVPARRGGPAATGADLRPGRLDGLDAAWCRALAAAGVTTLEALADADDLATARRIGRSLPALVDLACLARRALRETRGGPGPSRAARALDEERSFASAAATTLPGIASISSPIHSTEHLFPKSRAARPLTPTDAGGPFA